MVAKDSYQTRVVVDLLKHYNWSYIAVVYVDTEYERNLAKSLRHEIRRRQLSKANNNNNCFPTKHIYL